MQVSGLPGQEKFECGLTGQVRFNHGSFCGGYAWRGSVFPDANYTLNVGISHVTPGRGKGRSRGGIHRQPGDAGEAEVLPRRRPPESEDGTFIFGHFSALIARNWKEFRMARMGTDQADLLRSEFNEK